MDLIHDALRAGHATPPAGRRRARHVLLAGGAGVLGAALLERLLARREFAQVGVVVTQPLNVGVQGLVPVPWDAAWEAQHPPEDAAIVVFDRDRHSNGREQAFWRPEPAQLPLLARRLHARGVGSLLVVLPHAPATLPQALKQGLANLDEHAVAALGFRHLVFMRSAQAPDRMRSAKFLQRVADWMLSQLRLMIPPRDQPVRAQKVAQLAAELVLRLPGSRPGTRVVGPELVWEASQADDVAAFAAQWISERAAPATSAAAYPPPAPARRR